MKSLLLLLMIGLFLAPGVSLAGDRPSHAEKRLQASIDRIDRTLRRQALRARLAAAKPTKREPGSARIGRMHALEYHRKLFGCDHYGRPGR